MADTTDLLNQILSRLDEQGRDIKSVKQDSSTLKQDMSTAKQDIATVKDIQQVQGEKLDRVDATQQVHSGKLDKLGEAVGGLEDGQNRQYTTMKILQGTIEETKAEVDKLLRRPRQAD